MLCYWVLWGILGFGFGDFGFEVLVLGFGFVYCVFGFALFCGFVFDCFWFDA